MKTCLVGLLGTLALLLLGCRADPNTVLLERELRRQEDQIYRLEDELDQKSAQLETCRKQNTSSRPKSDFGAPSAEPMPESGPLLGPQGGGSPAGGGSARPPVISLPDESLPAGKLPETLKVPEALKVPGTLKMPETPQPSGTPKSSGAALPSLLADPMQTVRATASNVNVTRITLVPTYTGGYNVDSKPGDDGITVMIAPRGAAAEVLDAPAAVQVSLLDEELRGQGEAARLGLWEFTSAEIARRFRRSGAHRGVYLELLWRDKLPQHGRLHVYVRYTTTDGRELQADQAVEISLGDGKSWAPPLTPRGPLRAKAAPKKSAPESDAVQLTPPQVSGPSEPAAKPNPPADPKPQATRPIWSPYR